MKRMLKNAMQKIIIVISILLTFNFVVPTHVVQADIGGILLSPLVTLLAALGDGAMTLMQWAMIGDFSEVYQEEDDLTDTEKNEILNMDEDTENATILNKDGFNGDYKYPVFQYSPEQIFNNKIAALDVNFIQNSTAQEGMIGQDKSSVAKLRPVIARWYVSIRNIALVGLLSVLVYIGIRMLVASASSDKAKYKQMLMDWVVALCLLFVFHFIMSFVMVIIDNITDMLGSGSTSIRVQIGEDGEQFSTNLIGLARLGVESKDASEKISFTIIYLVLVIYTGIFTFVYLKRLLYMAFLTLMAPLVTLTYPIDKISDGKAQAFDTWLKEYIFNALLQPFHLLLYTILVTSAIELAANNMLYAIAAIGFLLPAEKLLRKMFGFGKADTASSLGSFAGGALAAQAISKVASSVANKGKSNKSGGTSGNGGSSEGNNKIKTKEAGYEGFKGADGLDAGDGANGATGLNGTAGGNGTGGAIGIAGANGAQGGTGQNADYSRRLNPNEVAALQARQQGNSRQAQQNQAFRSRIPEKPKGVKAKAAALGRGMANKMNLPKDKKDFNYRLKKTGKKVLKAAPGTLARTAAKVAGATTLGAIGLAAGIAAGDPSKAFQLGGAGLAAGGALGGAAGKAVTKAGSKASSYVKDAYNIGAYGAEGAQMIKTMDDYKNNDINRNYIANEMTDENGMPLRGEELDNQVARAAEYSAYGVGSNEEIVKAMKYEDKLVAENGMSREQARQVAAETSTLSAAEKDLRDKLSDPQKCEALRQKQERMIKAEAQKNGQTISDSEAASMSHAVVASMQQYNGIAPSQSQGSRAAAQRITTNSSTARTTTSSRPAQTRATRTTTSSRPAQTRATRTTTSSRPAQTRTSPTASNRTTSNRTTRTNPNATGPIRLNPNGSNSTNLNRGNNPNTEKH